MTVTGEATPYCVSPPLPDRRTDAISVPGATIVAATRDRSAAWITFDAAASVS
jgi:hypothetical protein